MVRVRIIGPCRICIGRGLLKAMARVGGGARVEVGAGVGARVGMVVGELCVGEGGAKGTCVRGGAG